MGRRHGWQVETDQIGFAPGIVPGISSAIQCFTGPGDRIMIQPPVYHPFAMIIRENGREIVNNPLVLENGRYRMDFEHMRKAVRGCGMFILCNPHNPGGRVWNPEELEQVAEICAESGTLVISDEIHADLTLPGRRHTVFATVSEKARNNSVTYMAASKAFNVPGLASSYLICQNPALLEKYQNFVNGREMAEGHVFAYAGLISAYTEPGGEEWLRQALDYIQENICYLDAELRRRMPRIKALLPDASYLVFLDCRELNLVPARTGGFLRERRPSGPEQRRYLRQGRGGFHAPECGLPPFRAGPGSQPAGGSVPVARFLIRESGRRHVNGIPYQPGVP